MHILENEFIKKYSAEAFDKLKILFPDLPDDYIRSKINHGILKNIDDKEARIRNTYYNYYQNTSLTSILHNIETTNPIVTGNGTMFERQDISEALPLYRLVDKRKTRTLHKNMMFKYIEQGEDDLAMNEFFIQDNEKRGMNSFYGGMGMKTAFQFNLSTAGAITAQGRSIISTTAWFIEGFFGYNIPFLCFDDLMHYVYCVESEPVNKQIIDEWVDYIPEDIEIVRALMSNYRIAADRKNTAGILLYMVRKMDKYKKIKLFYKNRMQYLFIHNPKIWDLMSSIMNSNIPFHNPYVVPPEFVGIMNTLIAITFELAYCKSHIIYDKVNKFKTLPRRIIIYSDTDSVFINGYKVMEPLLCKYFNVNPLNITLDLLKMNEPMVIKTLNVFAKILYEAIHQTYDQLCANNNIPLSYREYISIKNELLMDVFVIPPIKKAYMYRMIMKEGVQINPPKVSFTGGTLSGGSRNATVIKETQQVISDIALSGKTIYPTDYIKRMDTHMAHIKEQINLNGSDYRNIEKVKPREAYAKPDSNYSYTAAQAYKLITGNPIQLPGTFYLYDVDIPNLDAVADLKDTYPEYYNNFKEKIFIPGTPYSERGVRYICVPIDIEDIPEWIKPYIRWNDIIDKHVRPLVTFSPAFGLATQKIKNNNYYSTILSI